MLQTMLETGLGTISLLLGYFMQIALVLNEGMQHFRINDWGVMEDRVKRKAAVQGNATEEELAADEVRAQAEKARTRRHVRMGSQRLKWESKHLPLFRRQ